MNGILFDVKRFAVHDGPGIRTTLFLKGCPLHCLWCHNPEGISPGAQLAYYRHKCIACGECVGGCTRKAHAVSDEGHSFDREKCIACGACESVCLGEALKLFGRTYSVEQLLPVVLEDLPFYHESGGGVTLSGGEPLSQATFSAELLRAMKSAGLHTAVDTCGFVGWEAFEKVLALTDIFLFDLKHTDGAEHKRLTGQDNAVILTNLERLAASGARIEIRFPLVPGLNDSEQNIRGTGSLLKSLSITRVKVLQYHDLAHSKYEAIGMKDALPPIDSSAPERVSLAMDKMRGYGLEVVP